MRNTLDLDKSRGRALDLGLNCYATDWIRGGAQSTGKVGASANTPAMAAPRTVLWNMEPHTAAKHKILVNYLGAWLPIMSFRADRRLGTGRGRLLLVDGFCGPGRYKGGEDGSPILMLKAFLEHSQRDLIKSKLTFFFIDSDKARMEHLQEVAIPELEAKQPGGKFPDQVTIICEHGDFEEVYGPLLDGLEQAGKRPADTFAFIDPFGYSDVTMDLNGRILDFSGCEALVYVPFPFIYRFMGMENQTNALNGLFGSSEWKKARALQGEAKRKFLHDLYRDQLSTTPSGKRRYVRSFDIPSGTGNGYHLFFSTGHEKGMEVMKDAMWSVDPIAGKRFVDSTDSEQLVIFQEEVDTGPLLAGLQAHFGTDTFTIEEATTFTILESAFKKGHLRKKTLKPAEEGGKIEVVNPKPGRRKGSFTDGTTMRFV